MTMPFVNTGGRRRTRLTSRLDTSARVSELRFVQVELHVPGIEDGFVRLAREVIIRIGIRC